VFDIGANGGAKSVIFADLADGVVSVEPSPGGIAVLKQRFLNNPRVIVIGAGVGSKVGTETFHMFEGGDCYNTFSSKWVDALAHTDLEGDRPAKTVGSNIDIPMVTLDCLIQEHGMPDYIKIDVEGYELEVIKGLSRRIKLISFECNLPEYREETLQIILNLSSLSANAKFNYCTTEPPTRLEADRWLTPSEITAIVKSPNWRFVEIYCRAESS
jgi:FkbM family methyltransferase